MGFEDPTYSHRLFGNTIDRHRNAQRQDTLRLNIRNLVGPMPVLCLVQEAQIIELADPDMIDELQAQLAQVSAAMRVAIADIESKRLEAQAALEAERQRQAEVAAEIQRGRELAEAQRVRDLEAAQAAAEAEDREQLERVRNRDPKSAEPLAK